MNQNLTYKEVIEASHRRVMDSGGYDAMKQRFSVLCGKGIIDSGRVVEAAMILEDLEREAYGIATNKKH